jgi:hypothetical protein
MRQIEVTSNDADDRKSGIVMDDAIVFSEKEDSSSKIAVFISRKGLSNCD